MLQPCQRSEDRNRQPHRQEQRFHQVRGAAHQHVVHEQAGERRYDQAGHHEEQAGRDHVRQGRVRPLEPGTQRGYEPPPDAAALEVAGRLERQSHTGERLIEFAIGHDPRSAGRVVEKDAPAPEPLEDHEVVEVPMNHHGKRQVRQRRRFPPVAAGNQSVSPRALQKVARLASVARDAARYPQLFESHEPPEVGQHHGKRRRPALDRLHLQHRRHPYAALSPTVRQHAPHQIHGPHGYTPNCSRKNGITISTGRRRSTVIRAPHSVPVRMSIGGPETEDHL